MKLIAYTLFVILCSCASLKGRQEQLKLNYSKGKFDAALKVINQKDFKEKENRLLYLAEEATIYYYQNKLLLALSSFQKAQELANLLYTKSIRELILSGFMGDQYESFYGKIYERSALFHMQILAMYKLYSNGEYLNDKSKLISLSKSDRKKYLLKARSVVLAWNSFHQTIQKENRRNFFAYDYHQRMLSALIHEEIKKTSDLNTAIILYQNTLRDIDKLISLYPSFNSRYEEALKEYFEGKKITKINYTSNAKDLIDFLKFKILYLTKKYRKYSYKKTLRRLSPNKEILAKLKDRQKSISFIYSKDFLDVMETKLVAYNLNWILNKIEDPTTRALVEVIGVSTLTYFTLGTLGFSTYHTYRNGRYVYRNFSAGNELIKNVGIELKIPYVDPQRTQDDLVFELKGKKNYKLNSGIFNTYSDKLFVSTKQFANKYYDTIGPKIALKYLVAILAAYQTHKQLKQADNPLASMITVAQFVLSTKAISATQSVDTRHWVGLSKNSYLANGYIREGDYELVITDKLKKSEIYKKQIKIDNNSPSLFFL